jgi:alpha-amylase
MKNISLTFNIHHHIQLKKYRFFDIGNDGYYYDDIENERLTRKATDEYYLPTNEILLDLIKIHKGQFKVAFAISGTAIDLFSIYTPEVIESFQRLAATGCVEFLGETYAHSLASIKDKDEFKRQVEAHVEKIEELFGQRPRTFINSGLIYSDNIGEITAEMGFRAVLTEGVRHILKKRSPNHLYCNPLNPDLKILLNNTLLSEDIAFRLSDPNWTGWPSTKNNYLSTLNRIPADEEIVNLYMDYDVVGKGQKKGTGVFNFLKSLPQSLFEMTEYTFMTPSEIACYNQPFEQLSVPETIFHVSCERELIPLLSNELQKEAIEKLYELNDKIDRCLDPDLLIDWHYLQSIDHFKFMDGKFLAVNGLKSESCPYDNFYEAFMNYMNVLNDFKIRVNHSLAIIQSDFVEKNMKQRVAI